MGVHGETDEENEFCEAWVKLMMGCISTATYSILINGEP